MISKAVRQNNHQFFQHREGSNLKVNYINVNKEKGNMKGTFGSWKE
jgi:hypothetical protein